MKFTIERNALLKTLGHVQSVVERRNTIPILSNVMIEADGDGVAMTATDLDISIVERTSAAVGQPGATTVPAHTLFDIARKLPDGAEVELALEDGDRLTVKAGRSRFTLACLDKDDFPTMSESDLPHRFAIAGEELKRLIDKAPLCYLDGRNPLLSQRYLFACCQWRCWRNTARRCHRWPQAGTG